MLVASLCAFLYYFTDACSVALPGDTWLALEVYFYFNCLQCSFAGWTYLLLLVLCLCVALQLQIMIPELLNSTDFSQDYDSLSMCLCLYVPMLSTTQLCLQYCISIHIDIHVHLVLPPGHLIPSHCSSYFIATFCLLSPFPYGSCHQFHNGPSHCTSFFSLHL